MKVLYRYRDANSERPLVKTDNDQMNMKPLINTIRSQGTELKNKNMNSFVFKDSTKRFSMKSLKSPLTLRDS